MNIYTFNIYSNYYNFVLQRLDFLFNLKRIDKHIYT